MFPRRKFPPRRPRIRENVNENIRAREVRAVSPDGEVEVLQTHLAIRKARDLGLDLILVSPTAVPPVAKIMDYGQWQYEQKKKEREDRLRRAKEALTGGRFDLVILNGVPETLQVVDLLVFVAREIQPQFVDRRQSMRPRRLSRSTVVT